MRSKRVRGSNEGCEGPFSRLASPSPCKALRSPLHRWNEKLGRALEEATTHRRSVNHCAVLQGDKEFPDPPPARIALRYPDGIAPNDSERYFQNEKK